MITQVRKDIESCEEIRVTDLFDGEDIESGEFGHRLGEFLASAGEDVIFSWFDPGENEWFSSHGGYFGSEWSEAEPGRGHDNRDEAIREAQIRWYENLSHNQ